MPASSSIPTGRDFATTFESGYDPARGLRHGGASDRLRDRLVREEKARIERLGFEPATIVNLHPFPLSLNLGELGCIEVPARAPSQDYASLVLHAYRLSMRDLGDGNFTPLAVLPIELAREFEREYAATGGVFILSGAIRPSAEQLAAARASLLLWHRREFQQAMDAWTRYRQHKFITERQRDAARELYRLGEITALPDWLAVTHPGAGHRACPACGEEVKPSARICRHCRFHLDPAWVESHAAALSISDSDQPSIADRPSAPAAKAAANSQASISVPSNANGKSQRSVRTPAKAITAPIAADMPGSHSSQ